MRGSPVTELTKTINNNPRELNTGKDARDRELTIFINFSRALASFPVNQFPRLITYNSSGVNTGKDADLEN